jgi:hypothetical protein
MLVAELSGSSQTISESKKRGRKPTNVNYFDVKEEIAVRMFLTATTYNERNDIYNEFLRAPLDKMIESIIRRYKLYRKDMDFIEIHNDTHSFLITKIEKFKPDKNKKAYSYFGTICKNYLMGQIMSLENRPDMIYHIDGTTIEPIDVIEQFIKELKEFLLDPNMNENEQRLGNALVELFENYDDIFIGNDNNKFNKNIILLSLREMTNLSTKEIRTSMKRFKKLYFELMKRLNEL